MGRTWKDPAGAAPPGRALEIVFADGSEDSKPAPQYEAPAWPIRLLARRHGLTVTHAALVASFAFPARIGGAA